MNFDLKKTAIYDAYLFERYLLFRWDKYFKRLFFVLFIFFFLTFLFGFANENFSQAAIDRIFGAAILSLTFALVFAISDVFFNSKIKQPRLEASIADALAGMGEYNVAEFLGFETAKAAARALGLARLKRLPEVNSTLLFYFLILDNPSLNFIFSRALLSLPEIKELLRFQLGLLKGEKFGKAYSADFQNTILEALKIAESKGRQRVALGDMLAALAKHNSIFQEILIQNNLQAKDIENLVRWQEYLEEKISERKRFWEWKNLIKKGSLAKQWTSGYTITLDRFSVDITERVKRQGFPEVIGHQKEIESMERVLSQRESKNNVLIVGEPGSGRKSMVSALAQKAALGESLPDVNYKRVAQLDLPTLLAQTQSSEEVETILDTIFGEAITAGNIILVIDEFHNFIGGGMRPGVIDISGTISPYLQSPQFQLVAITTFEGLHKNIEQNSSILALFEKVEVAEISEQETLTLLENLTLSLERKRKKFISYQALRDIISLSAKYMPAIPFPEKAMDLLDSVVVYVSQTKDNFLLPEHVAKVVREKTQIPVGEIETKEREILLNLEHFIHQRIINQEEAVKEISTALRRARSEVTVRKGPMGAFLFLGPTGVGKTETSKALAEIYFGSESRMIRLDMSEFQQISDISRLLGAPGQEGLLTTPIRETPFSLILLDELEKAHPNILNLFLQVFDEGHLTDGQGRKTDFKSSIIIATSNAAYQIILEALKEKTDWQNVKPKLLDFLFAEGVFRPEFINRFDAVVIFRPLSKENLLDIAELLLQKLNKNLKEKGIEFVITQALKEKIVELGYSPVFGARAMRRVIQDKVENVLASAILSERLTRGGRAEIDPETFQLKINP